MLVLPYGRSFEVEETIALNTDNDPNFDYLGAYFDYRCDKDIPDVTAFRSAIAKRYIEYLTRWEAEAFREAKTAAELAEKTIHHHTLSRKDRDEHTLDLAGRLHDPLKGPKAEPSTTTDGAATLHQHNCTRYLRRGPT